jgi:hypothetical protein
MMEELSLAFEERFAEIEAYLQFLEGIEKEARLGPPRLGKEGIVITTQQQRILYSSVFLQLYNLIEATVGRCLDGVTQAAMMAGTWTPADLTDKLRREWVRVMARTHVDLNYEHRLEHALALCEHLVGSLPVVAFKVEKSGGSWDDDAIRTIATRLGFDLCVDGSVYNAIKRPFKDDLGAMSLVKKLRNDLAHGSISFAECGENLTVAELRQLTDCVSEYMRQVVRAFKTYIEGRQYLVPAKRPT